MFKNALQTIRRVLLCGALCVATEAVAETVSAKATLSGQSVGVGDSVEYRIALPGVSGAISAPVLSVDGLTALGPQLSREIRFGTGLEATTTLVYTLEPQHAGTFTIPALRFRAGNQTVETQPVSFKAEENKQSNKGRSGDSARAWAEIVLPRKTVYLGEMLPIEIRMYLDSAIQWRLEAIPSLDGEGFTKSKLSEPKKAEVERDGRQYDEIVLHTSITPIKAGTIRIGPSEFEYQAQIPRARPNRSRSPFGDFFGDDFFNDPLSPFVRMEQRKTVAEPVELTVKPLPVKGRPANFSGAVGEFTFSGEGSPSKVKVGDPITMKLKVGGAGNFDRVGPPVLAESKGWRAYPPSANFKPDDDVGSHGMKTFEIAVIPEEKKTQMPVFEFTYFDPLTERYVTAASGHLPLTVEGDAPSTPPPVVHAQATGGTSPSSTDTLPPPPQPQVNDIHGITYDFGAPRSFEPLYLRRGFWLAQLAPLFLLTGAVFLKLRKPKVDTGRIGAMRRERAAQFARLRRERDRTAFYDSAARVLQFHTALLSGQAPDVIDSGTVLRVLKTDPANAAMIEEVFHARAEALYAGGGGREEISDADRRRLIEAIEHLGGVK